MVISVHVELWFKSMGDRLTITELGQRTGLASSALRFYERKGLLRSAGREGGMRVYRSDSIEQVARVDLLKLAGFTLNEIAGLIDTDGRVARDWRGRARAKLAELDGRLRETRRARVMLEHTIQCPHKLLHECPIHQQAVRSHAATLAGRRTNGRRQAE
jgi:DNA-binding transcriptional MerR regulator